MAYTYQISLEGSKVSTKIVECDAMRASDRVYVRVHGVHGWVVKPVWEVFDSIDDCRAALVSQLGGIEATAARALSQHSHNNN